MRVIAILAAYNEERFIEACLRNLIQQGIDVYLIDNESTDGTVAVAERYLDHGLIWIESMPNHEVFRWKSILQRKTRLAAELDADWFMHVDADEIRLPSSSDTTLLQEIKKADQEGYNAINFFEFAFVPTQESPDHDHPDFEKTMRWYYPFQPVYPHRLNLWKKQKNPVDLVSSGGHAVCFPGLEMNPISCPMRHYLFLSRDHAIRKYVLRRYDPAEIAAGWNRARVGLTSSAIRLQPESELRYYTCDDELDSSNPVTKHPLFQY